jgi:hypothetical protein
MKRDEVASQIMFTLEFYWLIVSVVQHKSTNLPGPVLAKQDKFQNTTSSWSSSLDTEDVKNCLHKCNAGQTQLSLF